MREGLFVDDKERGVWKLSKKGEHSLAIKVERKPRRCDQRDVLVFSCAGPVETAAFSSHRRDARPALLLGAVQR